MKLITVIVQDEDANKLLNALVAAGFGATKISSTGGFLRRGNSTIIIGAEDEQVERVIGIIKDNCATRTRMLVEVQPWMEVGDLAASAPIEVEVGGATIFVQAVERMERV